MAKKTAPAPAPALAPLQAHPMTEVAWLLYDAERNARELRNDVKVIAERIVRDFARLAEDAANPDRRLYANDFTNSSIADGPGKIAALRAAEEQVNTLRHVLTAFGLGENETGWEYLRRLGATDPRDTEGRAALDAERKALIAGLTPAPAATPVQG